MSRLFTLLLCVTVPSIWAGQARDVQAEEVYTVPVGFWTPQEPPRVHYSIDFAIRLAEQATLQGRETIRFTNTTRRPIQTLAITWSRLGPGTQTLNITAAGQPVALPAGESYPKDFVLAKPVAPAEALTLEVQFGVSVPTASGMPEEASMSDWHPQLWWGCSSHNDYDVKISVPKEYTVATSGRLDPESGRYRIEGAPSFGIFLGKNRDVLRREAGDVSILCVHEPKNKKCAELLIDTAVDVVNFYRERFGFYPHRALSIVPGMDSPAGGYLLATGISVIHGMGRMTERPELHWRWITAHEIGHQYWGSQVMEKDDPGWLWIGLGIYMDREYCRARNLGTDKHRELVARYLQGIRQGLDTTVNRSQEEQQQIKFDFNNVVTHGKGFAIVSTLDCLLGKDTFQRVHKRCLSEFAGRRMGLSEFQAVCEQESGQDLAWFFDQWVNSDKYLAYEIASQNCEKGELFTTTVQVRCLGTLKMPVPVTAYFDDGTSQQAFTDRLRDVDTLRFRSRAPLKQVRLDAEQALPMVVPPPSPRAREVSQALEALPWTGAGEKALDAFKKAKECDYPDAGSWFKIGLTLYDGKYYREALDAFEKVQTHGRQADPSRASAAIVWQGHLLDLLGEREKAITCYKKALALPVPPDMRHAQYQMRINREWIEKRLNEPFRRE